MYCNFLLLTICYQNKRTKLKKITTTTTTPPKPTSTPTQPNPSNHRNKKTADLGDDELCVLGGVEGELVGDVRQGDAGVGEADHAHARLDDVVAQADDQGVRVLGLELGPKLGQHLVELGQVARPHGCNTEKQENDCLVDGRWETYRNLRPIRRRSA